MAPIPTEKKSLGSVLVIGGCGFLGHHIVSQILDSYKAKVTVLDLHTTRNRFDGVTYHNGDITTFSSIIPVFQEAKPDVVIHTASPTLAGGSRQMYKKVNVDGTACVIEACQKSDVKVLVYTSSASVIHDTVSDLINADERWPVIPGAAQAEYYSQTKAEAEALVLAANRSHTSPNFLTCSIRPSGIFGPGDVQVLPPIINVYHTNKTGYQLGANENLFDFTYVGNVAHAHLLAALALLYTCKLSTQGTTNLTHEAVDGEAFFITNDSPVYFWDFARAVWAAAGSPHGTEHVWIIGKDFGLALGTVADWVMWAIGRKSKLTPREVKYSSMTRYFDITKAKKRLGYKPIVDLGEGIKMSVQWFEKRRKEEKTA